MQTKAFEKLDFDSSDFHRKRDHGKQFVLFVREKVDLKRRLLLSDQCSTWLPELNFRPTGLPVLRCTLGELLAAIRHKLGDKLGDSLNTEVESSRDRELFNSLKRYEEVESPFLLILNDPFGISEVECLSTDEKWRDQTLGILPVTVFEYGRTDELSNNPNQTAQKQKRKHKVNVRCSTCSYCQLIETKDTIQKLDCPQCSVEFLFGTGLQVEIKNPVGEDDGLDEAKTSAKIETGRVHVMTAPALPSGDISYFCDACEVLLKDFRFTCITCRPEMIRGSFDICDKCYKDKEYLHKTHKFVKEQIFPNHKDPPEGKCAAQQLQNAFKAYPNRPYIGTREILSSGEPGDTFVYMTFEKVYETSLNFSVGLMDACDVRSGDFVGICARNTPEWVMSDCGLIMKGIVVVPIHFTMDEAAIRHVINHAELKAVICTEEMVPTLLEFKKTCEALKHIISINYKHQNHNPEGFCRDLKVSDEDSVYDFNELVEIGSRIRSSLSVEERYMISSRKESDIATIIFTSGSSGTPKGAIITDRMLRNEILLGKKYPFCMLVHEPLAWATARGIALAMLNSGAQLGIHMGHADTLMDDFQIVRPTSVSGTPALWNNVTSQFLLEVKKAEQERIASLPSGKTELNDLQKLSVYMNVRTKYNMTFGNRLQTILTGGAATSKAVIKLLKEIFRLPVYESYGATEVGGITGANVPWDGVSIELIDVPELGYLTTDDPPRGEICAHTKAMIPGYYKDDELNEKAFIMINGKRYFKTGDVGERVDEKIIIIDRLKYIFKLSQGEFVAPEPLEQTYEESLFVEQIFITGDINQHSVVGIVVPAKETVLNWIQNEGVEDFQNYEEFCEGSVLKKKIIQELVRIAQLQHHKLWEIPQNIYIEPTPFTADARLLTPSAKKKRLALSKHYSKIVDNLYSESQSDSTLPERQSNFRSLPELGDIVSDVLPIRMSVNSTQSFGELGMDSLTAARLVSILNETYKLQLTLPALLKLEPLGKLEVYIWKHSAVVDRTNANPLFGNGEHSKQNPTLMINWRDEFRLPRNFPLKIPTPYETCDYEDKHILLTGATGFLGAFLLCDLLKHSAYQGKKVYCLIRPSKPQAVDGKTQAVGGDAQALDDNASSPMDGENEQKIPNDSILDSFSDVSALSRLVSTLKGYKILDGVDMSRVIAISGNLEKENFGVAENVYKSLSATIGRIFHCGAMVNSVLPYSSHHSANVLGTLSILRFAFTELPKHVEYISTLSVIPDTGNTKAEEPIKYSEAIEGKLPGYAQSKRVADHLISEAVKRGLCARIHRPATISGSTKTGVGNRLDFTNLLICGVIQLQCFPRTFLGLPSSLSLVPVDYVSSAIVHISQLPSEDTKNNIFHYTESSKIRISDVFQWISAYGKYPLKPVNDSEWRKHVMEMDEANPFFFSRESLLSPNAQTEVELSDIQDGNTQQCATTDIMELQDVDQTIFIKYLTFFEDEKLFYKK